MTEKVGDVGTFDQKLKQLEDKRFVDLSARTTAKSSLRPSMWEARSRTGDAHAPKAEVNAVMDIIENLLHGVYVLPDMAESLIPSLPIADPNQAVKQVVGSRLRLFTVRRASESQTFIKRERLHSLAQNFSSLSSEGTMPQQGKC